jgi:hypothetical protein
MPPAAKIPRLSGQVLTVLLDMTYVISGIVNSDTTALHAPNTLVGG